MLINNDTSFQIQEYTDEYGNLVSVPRTAIPMQVVGGRIETGEVLVEIYHLYIDNMYEIMWNQEIIDATQFKVDYRKGRIYVHQSLEGQFLNLTYTAKGKITFLAKNTILIDEKNLYSKKNVEYALEENGVRLDNLVGSLTSDSEVIDLRVDTNNVVHPNAKSRADSDFNTLNNNKVGSTTIQNIRDVDGVFEYTKDGNIYKQLNKIFVNVKDYGSKLVNNDWGVVVNYIISQYPNGATIYFPAGTYNILTPIVLQPYITLTGDNDASILTTNLNIPIIKTNEITQEFDHIVISKLWLKNTNTTDLILHYHIELANPTRTKLFDLKFDTASPNLASFGGVKAYPYGVLPAPQGTFCVQIKNCTFGASSIFLGVTDSLIMDSLIWGNNRRGAIRIAASSQQIRSCQIVGGAQEGAIWMEDVDNIKINNVYFDGSYSFIDSGVGITAKRMTNSSITNCNFWNQMDEGFIMEDCHNVTITANMFQGNNRRSANKSDIKIVRTNLENQRIIINANTFERYNNTNTGYAIETVNKPCELIITSNSASFANYSLPTAKLEDNVGDRVVFMSNYGFLTTDLQPIPNYFYGNDIVRKSVLTSASQSIKVADLDIAKDEEYQFTLQGSGTSNIGVHVMINDDDVIGVPYGDYQSQRVCAAGTTNYNEYQDNGITGYMDSKFFVIKGTINVINGFAVINTLTSWTGLDSGLTTASYVVRKKSGVGNINKLTFKVPSGAFNSGTTLKIFKS